MQRNNKESSVENINEIKLNINDKAEKSQNDENSSNKGVKTHQSLADEITNPDMINKNDVKHDDTPNQLKIICNLLSKVNNKVGALQGEMAKMEKSIKQLTQKLDKISTQKRTNNDKKSDEKWPEMMKQIQCQQTADVYQNNDIGIIKQKISKNTQLNATLQSAMADQHKTMIDIQASITELIKQQLPAQNNNATITNLSERVIQMINNPAIQNTLNTVYFKNMQQQYSTNMTPQQAPPPQFNPNMEPQQQLQNPQNQPQSFYNQQQQFYPQRQNQGMQGMNLNQQQQGMGNNNNPTIHYQNQHYI